MSTNDLNIDGLSLVPVQEDTTMALTAKDDKDVTLVHAGALDRVVDKPKDWTINSKTLDKFTLFPRFPLELRSMIYEIHFNESGIVTIRFKKRVKRAGPDAEEIPASPVKLKRMFVYSTRMFTPESEANALYICKEAATEYRKAKPDTIKFMIKVKPVHFNAKLDLIAMDGQSLYFAHHYAQALRCAGNWLGKFHGLENLKNVYFSCSALKFDPESHINDLKTSIEAVELNRDAATKSDSQYHKWVQEARDNEIKKMRSNNYGVQKFFLKFLEELRKRNVQIWVDDFNGDRVKESAQSA